MKRLFTILVLVLFAYASSAQSFPTQEEIQQVMIEGPDWKVVRLKNRILNIQSSIDSTSVEYQICNLYLLPLYAKLNDNSSARKASESLYYYLNNGGREQLKDQCDVDELQMQVTLSLMSCYADEENYQKAQELGEECLRYAKGLNNHHYYSALQQVADVQNKLGDNATAYKNIKLCYNKFDNTEWLPGDATRSLINTTYFNVLRDLSIEAAGRGDTRKVKKYFQEALKIDSDYPETNTSLYFDSDFLISIVESLPLKTSNNELTKLLLSVVESKRKSYLAAVQRLNEEDDSISDNDYYASCFLGFAQDAMSQNKTRSAEAFINIAADLCKHDDVSSIVKEYTLDYLAYFFAHFKGDYLNAILNFEKLIPVRRDNDSDNLKATYSNILNAVARATQCNRYFYSIAIGSIEKQEEADYIPITSPKETRLILNEWKKISEDIISYHGKPYFNTLLVDYRRPINQRVFALFSLPDTKLMMAHNSIREADYETAFKIIQELVNEESLNNDKIQDLVWRIDNNLYLNTGYLESDSFLQHLRTASFVINNPDLIEWIDYERVRIKDWLGYAMGYAHGLAEEGKMEEANQEYDIILKQIQGLEKKDSLYLEVQLTRAIDLYVAKDDKTALEIATEIIKKSKVQKPQNYLLQCNTLWLIGECLRRAERYNEALTYCEENISLLKKNSVDSDGHHLQNIILQHGDILLDLKNYNPAEQSYIEFLSALDGREPSRGSDDHTIVISKLAQIYSEKLQSAIEQKNGELCQELYSKAIDLFKRYPKAAAGYHIYFGPFNERISNLLSLIPRNTITSFCEGLIDLDQIIWKAEEEKGKKTEIPPIEWYANVINCMANHCYSNHFYAEAIYFYGKAIDYVIDNKQYAWGGYLAELYDLRAIAKENAGEWMSSIEDRILAFKSSLESSDKDTEAPQKYFASIKTSVELATETSASFVNSMYNDAMHPHLSYEDNQKILQMWRICLEEVVDKYGKGFLIALHLYDTRMKEDSYLNQYGVPRPYIASEKLSYLAETYYIESLINIMDNRIEDFTESYKTLLEDAVPYDEAEDDKNLRYNLVMEMADALSHAGFSDWGFEVLGSYYQYLVSDEHEDFELAEKVTTQIGFAAWRMMDIKRLVWATSNAEIVANKDNPGYYRWMFYDINELISQLVILSRTQVYTNIDNAKATLGFAKELVDGNTQLSNGNPITSSTISLLYNDMAILTDDTQLSIQYYEKALANEKGFDPTTRINLATEYMGMGDYHKADTLLTGVYQYSQNQYLDPRWKASLFRALTRNAIYEKNFKKAQEFSKERLSLQILDYLRSSQSLTSQGRNNYWDQYYAQSLIDAASTDLACGDNGSNAYNAALFQKSILIRQKQSVKDNILQSNDLELKNAYAQYNKEIRSHSASATETEEYCMYLYSMHPEFVGAFKIPQWKEVQSQLGKNDLAIEFALSFENDSKDAYYVAILLRKNYETPRIVRLCKKEDLTNLVTKDRDIAGFSIGLYQDMTVLYRLIWEPIEQYLRGIKTIYYSPYELINNVNIETAYKQPGGKTVGSAYRLMRVSTTAELLPENKKPFESAILFGGLDYNAALHQSITPDMENKPSDNDNYLQLRGSMGGSWVRRPYMKDEVVGIQQLLSGKSITTTLYSADQGTEEVFKSLSGAAPDILHLATHGFYYTAEEADQYRYFNTIETPSYQAGVRSGVVLTGANHAWNGESIPQGSEDGILTADEISGMDLTGTSVLTLSACQTALGDITSDGVYGMQRSFKIAGVNTIIMSLWQVDDEATYIMMERFYQELANGKEKHEAFRIAQAAIRVWAEKRVNELREELSNLPPEGQEKKRSQYGGQLYPEYYWGAFVMLD